MGRDADHDRPIADSDSAPAHRPSTLQPQHPPAPPPSSPTGPPAHQPTGMIGVRALTNANSETVLRAQPVTMGLGLGAWGLGSAVLVLHSPPNGHVVHRSGSGGPRSATNTNYRRMPSGSAPNIAAVPRVARSQAGVFLARQAQAEGWSPAQIRHRRQTGSWVTILGKGMARSGTPLTAQVHGWATHLTFPAGVLSHQTAGALFDFPIPVPDQGHVLAERHRGATRVPGPDGSCPAPSPAGDATRTHRP